MDNRLKDLYILMLKYQYMIKYTHQFNNGACVHLDYVDKYSSTKYRLDKCPLIGYPTTRYRNITVIIGN